MLFKDWLEEHLRCDMILPENCRDGRTITLKDTQSDIAIRVENVPRSSVVVNLEIGGRRQVFETDNGCDFYDRCDYLILEESETEYMAVFIETQPYPSRKDEGNTSLDLALGTISIREKTEGGIELKNCSSSWVCFCEMKWSSDISYKVTHDLHRNQLARVIENSIFFNNKAGCHDQSNARYPNHVYVALVTPKVFRDANVKSRLYQYKFEDYRVDSTNLLNDLKSCVLEMCDGSADLAKQLERLSCLCWSTYDDIFAQIPASAISEELQNFWEKYRKKFRRS